MHDILGIWLDTYGDDDPLEITLNICFLAAAAEERDRYGAQLPEVIYLHRVVIATGRFLLYDGSSVGRGARLKCFLPG